MDNNLDMNEFDFNVSGHGDFKGDQNINLGEPESNPNNFDNNSDKETNINNNTSSGNNISEKPLSPYGGVNVPNSKDVKNNQNMEIKTEIEEPTKSTLDEPIITTLKRDLITIGNKIKYVLVPKMTEKKLEELYNWDLWGPLIFCFLFGIALSTGNSNSETSIFVLVFVIFWIGGVVITFNERFLGAEISICQVLSLLGYGMFPAAVAGIIIGFCKITNIYVKLVLVAIGLIWSIIASVGFFGNLVAPDKKLLAILPVFLYLISLSMFSLNY